MPAGIESYGAYVPIYRLSLETLAQVWGGRIKQGEKAIANWDEDSITMAVEAGIDCLAGIDRETVDGLYIASTSLPYNEKQSASIVAKALDLRSDVLTGDFTNSLRSGTVALRAALDAVNAGSAKRFLVISTDCRVPNPDSNFEKLLGDGAAALLVGSSNVIAEIEGSHTITSEFMDIWRRDGDRNVQFWEDRFIIQHGYIDHMRAVAKGLFEKTGLAAKDFAKAAYSVWWDKRRHAEAAGHMGFAPESLQDTLSTSVGNTGTAHAMMTLVGALEEAKTGDKIFFANYGDGADAFALRVTDALGKLPERRGIRKHVESKLPIPSYGKYLHFRNLMQWQTVREFPPYSSPPATWRGRQWIWSMRGHKCRQCGTIQVPVKRVCTWCQAKDDFEEVPLADKKATLFSYSIDSMATFNPDLPNVLAIVDFEGGGRLATTMTDRDLDDIQPNMPVELTFRKISEAKGVTNYFWKCRPIRM